MRSRQGAVLESLRRVQAFLDRNGEVLEPVIKSTGTQLAEVVDQLTRLAVRQDGGTRGGQGETAKQRGLRTTLRVSHMRPIAEVAKLRLREVPDFHALTMPLSNASTQRLITAANAMADAAAPHAAVLVENGLPADFLAQLRAAAEAVISSIAGRSTHQGARSGATAGLLAEEKRGRVVLKVLDSQVIQVLVGNDKLLAEWKLAKKVGRRAAVPVTAPDAPAPPAVPATAVAA
jgi:hypothetical protein